MLLVTNTKKFAALSCLLTCCLSEASTEECSNEAICAAQNTESNIITNPVIDQPEDGECALYLAPSSIPNAGLGLFVVRDIKKGEGILPHADGPSIVVCDTDFEEDEWVYPWYFWSGGGLASFECDEAHESVISFGSVSNYHTTLKNIKGGVLDYDDTVADRFTHPEAGSYSYYRGHYFKASRNIVAGEELFSDYGEGWLDYRHGTFADFIPRKSDFDMAGNVLNTMKKNLQDIQLKDEIVASIKDVVGVFDERSAALLPKSKKAYEEVTKYPEDDERHFSRVLSLASVRTRTVDWVKENGLCMDTIRPGKSTLPRAGQGAIAKRAFSKGDMISPAPLLQILNRDSLFIYDGPTDDAIERVGIQLLMNYCFGHQDSPMLLCPQSNVNLVNHCSDRKDWGGTCRQKGPNAKLAWSNGWDPNNESWLNMSLDEISTHTKSGQRGLSMELIAEGDIAPGEEIFIDYGPNWEEEWNIHKQMWNPPVKGSSEEDYTPVKEMQDTLTGFRTVDELRTNPYPDNIVTACYFYFSEDDEHTEEGMFIYGGDYIPEGGTHFEQSLWYCEILEQTGENIYDVRIPPQEGKDFSTLLSNYPRDSIILRTKKYKSDQHLSNSFRHYIEIPDDIFPAIWKTLKGNTE